MNFIIFGGTGFIGSHLTNLLNERFSDVKIYNFDIVKPGDADPKVKDYHSAILPGHTLGSEYVECDVRKSIGDVPFTPTPDDVIINLAAVHRTPGHEDNEYLDTNINGANNVVNFARRHGIKKILFTSSISPYAPSEELKTEQTAPAPNAPYGISKYEAEKIHTAWQAERPDERRLVILRPGAVFGRGENGNFTRLYRALKRRRFAYPGRKDTIKACIYVKDLVRFMLYLIESKEVNGVDLFNCTYHPAPTIEHIVNVINDVTGLHRKVPYLPNAIIMPAAAVIGAMGAPLGISPARVRKLQVSTNVSGAKMQASGFKMKYSLEEAFADWFGETTPHCLQ